MAYYQGINPNQARFSNPYTTHTHTATCGHRATAFGGKSISPYTPYQPASAKKEGLSTAQKAAIVVVAGLAAYGVGSAVRNYQGKNFNDDLMTGAKKCGDLAVQAYNASGQGLEAVSTFVQSFFAATTEQPKN